MTRKTALALTAQHGAQEPSQNNKINSSNSAKRKYDEKYCRGSSSN